jgi:ABC-type dipeptide/oligopeptide/nickel transport system permease subunit
MRPYFIAVIAVHHAIRCRRAGLINQTAKPVNIWPVSLTNVLAIAGLLRGQVRSAAHHDFVDEVTVLGEVAGLHVYLGHISDG